MKYGVIDYSYGVSADYGIDNRYCVNIGNDMQSLAVEHLYERLGIDASQIVRIGYHELRTYDGDYIVLPMNMFGTKDEIFPLSPRIVPFFIGFNYVSGRLGSNGDFIKPYAPIGCRDEYTLKVMREAGIESYLSGCLTITLPRRADSSGAKRVFLVDAPEAVSACIPEHLKENVEYLTHEIELDQGLQSEEAVQTIRGYAKHILDRYSTEAALVVTGRLHCAAPCMALGVPVIIAKENIDTNLSWIDKFARIYTKGEYSEIDWTPEAVDLEDIKDRTFKIFSDQLMDLVRSKRPLFELSEFYERRQKSQYNNLLKQQLVEQVSTLSKKPLRYAIWGVGAGGTLAHLLIQENFPQFRMVEAFDTFETGKFFDIEIQHPDRCGESEFDFLFICTHAGRDDASKKVSELGFRLDVDYMFLISKVVNSNSSANDGFKRHLAQFITN